ncbi:MAG: hypothetical protein M1459_02715 [Patescibacteria group bacterium]|nr:hypothetical protein [Patescibacteria group bacterium]
MNLRRSIMIILPLAITIGILYWFFLRAPSAPSVTVSVPTNNDSGFVPFDRTSPNTNTNSGSVTETGNTSTSSTTDNVTNTAPIPVLRQLSSTPVGGYAASSTASSTVVRWIDRGRGNIYEASVNSLDTETVSNTILPRVYESWWNSADTSFIGRYLDSNSDKVTTVIANITKRDTTGTSTDNGVAAETPYELRGKMVSGNVIAVTSSPKRDKILVVTDDTGQAVGYVSNFDGTRQTQVFSLPFTQINVDWPETNTIVITTKASNFYSGYLYFLNIKTGAITQILGDMKGLSAKVSHDGKKVLYSVSDTNSGFLTYIYDVKSGKSDPVIWRTLADKCAWSYANPANVYCAVSSQVPRGVYPDTWYVGQNSFVDSLWLLDTSNGDVRQIADLLNQGNAIIDAYNITLDANDEYLFFMNRIDQSLWSLDLVSSN